MVNEPNSPIKPKINKVTQMVSLFNSKISKGIEVDADKSHTIVNELSSESMQQPKATCKMPVPLPRTHNSKSKTPITLSDDQEKLATCFVPADVFAQLPVKEKAQLYMQFVEEMTKRNPKFGLMKPADHSLANRNDVIVEKQVRVKDLLEELELKSVFPKPIAPEVKAIQRMDSMKRACATRKNSQLFSPSKRQITKKPNSENRTSLLGDSPTKEQNKSTDSSSRVQQIDNLFFSWFKEKQEKQETVKQNIEAIQSEINEDERKSPVDKLLEEALAKLENAEGEQKEGGPKAMPRKKIPTKSKEISTTTSSCKVSASEESESGVWSLPPNTSVESVPEKSEKHESDFEFAKPLTLSRKKKFRKNSKCKKETTATEVIPAIPNDSQLDRATAETELKNTNLLVKTSATATKMPPPEPESTQEELDQSLMKAVNSPRKIKSAYTFTISDLEMPVCSPRPSLSFAKKLPKTKKRSLLSAKKGFSESLRAQGFQTDTDSTLKKVLTLEEISHNSSPGPSPMHKRNAISDFPTVVKSQEKQNPEAVVPDLAKKTSGKTEDAKTSSTSSSGLNCQADISKNQEQLDIAAAFEGSFNKSLVARSPLNYAIDSTGLLTPVQSKEKHSSTAKSSAKRLFSKVVEILKSRRKLSYDNESQCTDLAMQMIEEDHPFEIPTTYTSYSQEERKSCASNANSKQTSELPTGATSHFWIKSGEFNVSLQINTVEKLRLWLFYEIFSQASCDTKELHFGIDDNVFSVHASIDIAKTTIRTPDHTTGFSHYWFSTGDLTIPFKGQYLKPDKIENLFRFIKEAVEETGELQFGVDDIAFSNVSKFWHQPPKFSVESQYGMLVGLHSGESNGLEGRSEGDWPHTKPVMITDLDQSDEAAASTDEGSSLASLSVKNFDLKTVGNNMASFYNIYENVPLDQLFPDRKRETPQYTQKPLRTITVDEDKCIATDKDPHLIAKQENISDTVNPSYISKDDLESYKGTPEYIDKLKTIVSDIGNIGSGDNLKSCTIDQLGSYMYFLNRYAEVCLSSRKEKSKAALDALANYNPVIA